MQLQQNKSLLPYNTFHIDVNAEFFTELNDVSSLAEISALPQQKHILGGGSNILLIQPLKGIVIHNNLKGIVLEKEDDQHVWLRVASGEIWHELVMHTVNHGWGGLENLALIPGTVGASPIQNIGAYGVEAKETIESVECWSWNQRTLQNFSNSDCEFGYRDSIFKRILKNEVLITSVLFRLNKVPVYNISYGALEDELKQMGVEELSVKAIAYAVMNIRRSKLPDPKVTGNAGSFFKNPTISKLLYDKIHANYPGIPSYQVNELKIKVPAGWLIEQCGWKGYRKNDAGVHAKQALVLVNHGHAKGDEIWKLSGEIVASVKEKFAIELEREVQVW